MYTFDCNADLQGSSTAFRSNVALALAAVIKQQTHSNGCDTAGGRVT